MQMMPHPTQSPGDAAWMRLPLVPCGGTADQRDSAEFDPMRNRFLRILQANGWTRVAIVAPTPGCGTTYCAVQLALSLSELTTRRTVLIDMNWQAPGVAAALRLMMATDSSRRSGARPGHLVRVADSLAVGVPDCLISGRAGQQPDPARNEMWEDMVRSVKPEVVLLDMPPMLEGADYAAQLLQADAVMIVADANHTQPQHIDACTRILDGKLPVLGVFLNRA